MKRDMDFIRDLLLEIEGGKALFETTSAEAAAFLGFTPEKALSREEADNLLGHLDLLEDAQFVEIESRAGGGAILIRGLTWAGHDFLDSVRDPDTWAKTKKGAVAAGGFTVELLKDLAKGLIKKQIEDRTGVKL